MKYVALHYLGVEAKVHNKRELTAVDIFNSRMNTIAEALIKETPFGKHLREKGCLHREYAEMHGLADALFFMDIVERPISSVEIYEACEAVREASEAAGKALDFICGEERDMKICG